MTNLQRFDANGIEILIDTTTGESFASVSGYARMGNKDKSTISRRLQGVALENKKMAEIETPGGIQGVALVTEDLIVEWLPKDNPGMASQLMKLGVRMFLHSMAGYSVQSEAVKPEPRLLPQRDVIDYVSCYKDIASIDDPYIKSLAKDLLMDDMALLRNSNRAHQQQSLPGFLPAHKPVGTRASAATSLLRWINSVVGLSSTNVCRRTTPS